MGYVDAHHHLWDLGRRDQPWTAEPERHAIRRDFTPSDLAAATAGTGVTSTVLVQVLNEAAETRDLLAYARDGDLIRGVVGWVDLADPAVGERLAELRAEPGGERLVGVRHQMQAEPDPGGWLARPEVQRGLAAVAAAGLAYDLMIRPAQFEVAQRTAHRHPGLTLVLDHLGKPPIATGPIEPWAAGIHALASAPNVRCKLSGLVTVADPRRWTVADLRPYAETALGAFGPDRVLFGSDWPVCLLAASYDTVFATARDLIAGLTGAEQRSVLGDAARSAYGDGLH
jgi:L-fuconolactonase